MNKWFICKGHGQYFPPTTKREHELQMCKACIQELERQTAQQINEYMATPRFE